MEVLTVDVARQRVKIFEDILKSRVTIPMIAELGSCYFTLGEPERAIPLLRQAWSCDRKNSGYGMNLAMALKDVGRHEESHRVLEIAYANAPDDFYIQLGYAEALLRAGFWQQGWAIYDNARPTQLGAALDVRVPDGVQEWDGSALTGGQKLLVINEGGTGDRISYARWLPELTKRGIDWCFYPYPELYPIFERIFPKEQLLADEGPGATFSHWCTAFALPTKLSAAPHEIPPPLPVTALPEKIEKFRIGRNDDKPVIGLCYRAAEMFQGGRTVRSLSSAQAMRLMCQTGDMIHWVSLQHGERLDYPAINCNLSDWEDTLGLLANLDGVVTVDTSILHFAGAMNKPTACLLSSNSCWKFLTKSRQLPWYPSATFYRNEGHGAGFEYALNLLIAEIRQNGFAPHSTQVEPQQQASNNN